MNISHMAQKLFPRVGILFLSGFPLFVFAQDSLKDLIEDRLLILINPTIALLTGLALVYFFWGMAKFVYSAGSDQGREEGKQVMVWGIIVLFVIISIWGLLAILQATFFGSNLPKNPFYKTGSTHIIHYA